MVSLWNRKSCHFWALDDAGGGATGRAMGVGPASVIGTLMVDMASCYALGWGCPDGRRLNPATVSPLYDSIVTEAPPVADSARRFHALC